MRRKLKWFWQAAAALAVVGGLTFGTQTALAQTNTDPCQPCFSDFECDDCCWRVYGQLGECFELQQACLCF